MSNKPTDKGAAAPAASAKPAEGTASAEGAAPAAPAAPAPTAKEPPAAPVEVGPSFVCKEDFNHNGVQFTAGEVIAQAKLAKVDGPTLNRRMQNGFIGFAQ